MENTVDTVYIQHNRLYNYKEWKTNNKPIFKKPKKTVNKILCKIASDKVVKPIISQVMS